MIYIQDEEIEVSGQHIWLDNKEVACLSLSASLVTDQQAQDWMDKNYPGIEWCWGF